MNTSLPSDLRDRIIQEHAPIVAAPSFGQLAPLEAAGHRYIACRDRLMLEVRRPWLHLVWPITGEDDISPAMPFGVVEQRVVTDFGKVPKELLRQFMQEAQKVSPLEHAAWLVWDAREQRLKYRDLDITMHSEGRISYNRPALEAHESLAVDLHSHGGAPAFFSATDDDDDAGEVKIAAVVGGLQLGEAPSWAVRLCALGLYIDLPGPKDL